MIVDAYFDLDDGFKTLHTRCAVPLWKGFRLKSILPDDLIPVISKKELDAIAVRMINVLYPRVSKYADPISINQVVRRLRLSVQDVHFDSDEDLLAKIFFEDASTIIVDTNTQIKHIIPVSAGTILVNTPIDKIPDEHIRNNTIMHEVVHWLLHRPAFLLAKLWNRECAAIACRRPGGYSSSRQWTAIDRMEWQANSLAPRMLMPDWATRFIADGWQRRYSRLSPLLRMERTIDHLSMHFNVSRQLAKIRMVELGYEDAKTAFSYYDKRKHTISFKNATRELARNKSFLDALETGIYAYVDNCFVIRDSKYLYRDENGKGFSQTYLRTINNQLSAIMNHAVKYYGLSRNPSAVDKKMGKSKAVEMKFWTQEEFERFIPAVSDKPVSYIGFMILFWTGLRIGELLALTPADIDLEKRRLTVNKSYQRIEGEDLISEPKTPKSRRTISLPAFLCDYIADYEKRLVGLENDDRLFPYTKYFFEHEMQRGVKESGVKKIRIHDLRHSHASLLVSMGFSIKEIQQRLGHEKVETTLNTYAHLYPDTQDELADRLDVRFKGKENDG